MPELPEVETLCRQLHAKIAGETILAQKAYDQKLYEIGDVSKRIVRRVRRRGKTILLDLDNGQSLVIHLRMSGRLFWHASKTKLPHTRWRLNFTSGHADLVDPRRFATVKLEKTDYENAGREVLTRFDEQAFLLGQSKRKICVKTLMMDPIFTPVKFCMTQESLPGDHLQPLQELNGKKYFTFPAAFWKKPLKNGERPFLTGATFTDTRVKISMNFRFIAGRATFAPDAAMLFKESNRADEVPIIVRGVRNKQALNIAGVPFWRMKRQEGDP